MWFNALAVILLQIKLEFGLPSWMAGIGTTSAILGAMFGSMFWGLAADVIGRRPAFMMTLTITSISGCLAAFLPSIELLCCSLFLLGTGIGGNLPVDGALFLEYLPKENQSLLTLMSLFWPVGQVFSSSLGLLLIPNHSCDSEPCESSGWRYFLLSLSILTLLLLVARVICAFVESPKFYISKGNPLKAKKILEYLAERNNVDIHIDEQDLQITHQSKRSHYAYDILLDPKTFSTFVLVNFIWIFMAVGYTMFNSFLPIFLKQKEISTSQVFLNYVIISLCGIPGSVVGMWLADSSLGRKGTMALSTFGTAIFLYMFTVFTTPLGQLIVSCITSFLQNAMYGLLYSYTPEVFETSIRGKAVGLASGLSRLSGAFSPLLTGYLLQFGMSLPLYISSGMICTCAILSLFLPVETRGVAAK